jgi:hypothetical protein
MVDTWTLVVVAGSTVLARLGRELVALHRHRMRRTSIEKLVAGSTSWLRVIDRDADGAVIDITTSGSLTGDVSESRPCLTDDLED